MGSVEAVVTQLRRLRLSHKTDEYQIHDAVQDCLERSGFLYLREAALAPGCRVDFLVEDHIALEVKRGRPGRSALLQQLQRYAQAPQVESLIVLTEGKCELPRHIAGKPCHLIILRSLWGVAL